MRDVLTIIVLLSLSKHSTCVQCVGSASTYVPRYIASARETARYSTMILRVYKQAKAPVTDSTLLAGLLIVVVIEVRLYIGHALQITIIYSGSSECDY